MGTGGQETGAGGRGGAKPVRSLGPRMPRGTRMIFCPGCDSDLTLLEGARISSKPDSSGLKPSASTQKETGQSCRIAILIEVVNFSCVGYLPQHRAHTRLDVILCKMPLHRSQ